jgi:antiphage defense system Thoeris ThsB-like protein
MARRVFFSFHYQRDIWRVNVVRNCWITQDRQVAGYWDASLWEEAQKKGDAAIRKMIDDALTYTSVTVVLIGAETSTRQYVRYEIEKSLEKGNGLLGVYINDLKDRLGYSDYRGSNPFDAMFTLRNGIRYALSTIYPTYGWVSNSGFNNFAGWVEAAAKAAGR